MRKGTSGPFFVYLAFRSFKEPPKIPPRIADPERNVEETPEKIFDQC